MLYIFEMANNHQGSVKHAKLIVDKFSELAKNNNVNAAIKLQFRQLDTFIHTAFKDSDLKFVKRFNETKLSKEEFKQIVDYIKKSGLSVASTPFDNESIPWFDDFNIPIVKVASCSIDDWPLLEEISNINKKIIISTGGASVETLKKVYRIFNHRHRDFAFMHCVGEYPTRTECSNLNRINILKEEFPNIEIGLSTHESPNEDSLAPLSVAMGCTILEKHIGVETDNIKLNAYSCTPEQMQNTINKVQTAQSALHGKSDTEKKSLASLKRGVYINRNIKSGQSFGQEDFYYAMPCQENQYSTADIDNIIGTIACEDLTFQDPILRSSNRTTLDENRIESIIKKTKDIISKAKIPLSGKERIEISAHYGLEKFNKYGALIIEKINREYCKKIIIVTAGQQHPTHRHIKKEEAFELLHGDCTINLNGKEIQMIEGKPILITRGTNHSFRSTNGCVIEEVSTTHTPGDSIYIDPEINSLPLSNRKIKVKL